MLEVDLFQTTAKFKKKWGEEIVYFTLRGSFSKNIFQSGLHLSVGRIIVRKGMCTLVFSFFFLPLF